jgi:uncharacterized protein HemY
VVPTQRDAKLLNNLGIECNKKDGIYVCAKSPQLPKILRLKDFIEKHGINAYITGFSEFPIEQGYCIQVVSSKKKKPIEKIFTKFESYPYARVEKIGKYYVLRIGQSNDLKYLKPYLKKIKKFYKSAFLRKCDFILSRIVLSNGSFEKFHTKTKKNKKIKKHKKQNFNIDYSKLNDKKKLRLMKEFFDKGDYKQVLKIAELLEKGLYRKDVLVIKARILAKEGKYKQACRRLTELYNVYQDKEIEKYRNKACFLYYGSLGNENMYTSPFFAVKYFKKSLIFQKNSYVMKNLAIVYLSLGKYSKAYPYLKQLYEKYPDDSVILSAYARVLFALGKFSQFKKLPHKNPTFKNLNQYFSALKYYKHKEYAKAENILNFLHKIYKNDVNIGVLYAKTLINEKKYKKAENILNGLKNKNNIDIQKTFLFLFLKSKNYIQAFKYLKKLKLEKVDVSSKIVNRVQYNYYLQMAAEELKNKNFKDVYKLLQNAMNYGSNEKLYKVLGDYYFDVGKHQKALKAYKNAYYYAPKQTIVKDMIKTYFALNKPDKAGEFITENSSNKLKSFYYMYYAEYFLKKKNYIEANKMMKISVFYSKNKTNLQKKLQGIICYYLGNYDCAYKNLADLKDNEAKCYLVFTLIKQGKKEQAKNLLKNIKAKNNYLKAKIANAYLQLGEIKKAEEMYNSLK